MFIFCDCVSFFPSFQIDIRWHGDVRPAYHSDVLFVHNGNFRGNIAAVVGTSPLPPILYGPTGSSPKYSTLPLFLRITWCYACVKSTGSNIIYLLWPLDQVCCDRSRNERQAINKQSKGPCWSIIDLTGSAGASLLIAAALAPISLEFHKFSRILSSHYLSLGNFSLSTLYDSQPVFMCFSFCFHARSNWARCRHISYSISSLLYNIVRRTMLAVTFTIVKCRVDS